MATADIGAAPDISAITRIELDTRQLLSARSNGLNEEFSTVFPRATAETMRRLVNEMAMIRCCFVVLTDLLANIRSNGGITSDIVENTLKEIIDDFGNSNNSRDRQIALFASSMLMGEAAI